MHSFKKSLIGLALRRTRIMVAVISLIAACLVLVGSPASQGQNTSAPIVRNVSLTRGFDPNTELLFMIVQQDDAFVWIATELNTSDGWGPPPLDILPFIDQDSLYASFDELHVVLVDPLLNVHVIKIRRERDGSTTVTGPNLLHALGDPFTYGHPTSIAVIPRPQNPIDPWVAVGTDRNIILAKSGILPCVLPVGGPVIDVAVVPQVGDLVFVALVNRRDAQHLVAILPPPDDSLPEQIVFDLAPSEPPPDDGLVDLSVPPPDDGLTEPAPVHLIAANGTTSIYRLTIPARAEIGGSFSIEKVGDVHVPIKQVALASLALLPSDGSGVLYDPSFNSNEGRVGMPLLTIFGNSLSLFPETLQLSSEGQYITAVIESAGGNAAAIQLATIRLEVNGSELKPVASNAAPQLRDEDFDGNPDLAVKFNRKAFQTRIPRGANSVLATAHWTFTDGTTGFASSEIRVIE